MRVSVTKLHGGGGYHCEVYAPNLYAMNAVINAVTAITTAAGDPVPVVDIEHPTTPSEARVAQQLAAATEGPVLNVIGADQE